MFRHDYDAALSARDNLPAPCASTTSYRSSVSV